LASLFRKYRADAPHPPRSRNRSREVGGLLASTIREGQADGSIAAELDADQIARFLINSWGSRHRVWRSPHQCKPDNRVHSTTRGGRRPMLQSAPRQALSDCRRHGRVLICRTDGDDLSDIYPAASQRPTSEFRLFLLSTTIAFNQPSAKPRRSPKWFSR
jgi:hypothetical protein